jgi:DnaJ like chaperone protein
MGLLGLLVGGGIGFMLGGPLGAMFGGALGSMWGESFGPRQQHGDPRRLVGRCAACGRVVSFAPGAQLVCPNCGARLRGEPAGAADGFGYGPAGRADPRYAQSQAQSAFMIAMISLAAKVAKADGHVSPAEVRFFDDFLKNDLGMASEDRRIAARIFNQARDSAVPAGEFARQIRGLFQGQPDRLRDLVCLLLKLAFADGVLGSEEETLIRQIARDLGIGDRGYQECLALFGRDSLEDAYTALGLERTATDREVKSAYRRLAKEYHPDTLAAKGLSEEFAQYARDKIRTVNAAYERIREARGMR